MTENLVGQEFIVSVYTSVGEDEAVLKTLWSGYSAAFGELCDVLALPTNFPTEPAAAPCGVGNILAAVQSRGPGVHQMVLRRVQDMLALSVIRSPHESDSRGWRQWEEEWTGLWANIDVDSRKKTLGGARILQARRPGSVDDLVLEDPLRAAVNFAGGGVDPCFGGTIERSARLGPFAVWETSGPARRFVIVAPEAHDSELSAWTWSQGSADQAPFAGYLLHAAKLYHAATLRPSDVELWHALRGLDQQLDALQTPDGELEASAVLNQQFGTATLAQELGRRRQLSSVADVSRQNMTAYLDLDKPGGPFADDAAFATWLVTQLHTEEAAIQDRIDRSDRITEHADRVVRQRLQEQAEDLQERREQFTLTTTGAVGSILMALAAIQALSYKVPVPDQVKGPVVAILASFAILTSALVLRVSADKRKPWPALLVVLAAGMLAATCGWATSSVLAEVQGRVAHGIDAWTGVAISVTVVLVVSIVVRIQKSRSRSS